MKKFLSILLALLMLCSCSADEHSEQPGIDIPEELASDVPGVEIKTENLGVTEKATVGRYNWEEDNGDGTKKNVIACGAHPLDFKNITYFETSGKEKMTLVFEEKPVSYDIVRYEVEYNRWANGIGYNGDEKSKPVETENDSFVAAGDGKNYVYVINANYKNGNVEYAFEVRHAELSVGLYKIVDGAENGTLVLAGTGAGDIYTLNVGDIPVYLDGEPADASVIMDGMTAEIHHGGDILETYPASFGKVYGIHVYSIGTKNQPGGTYFDLCGLYIEVLWDLWRADEGLNHGIKYVSIDLSSAPGNLSESEKDAIIWVLSNRIGIPDAMGLTMEELKEQGYLTAAGGTNDLYQWDDGVYMNITDDSGEDFEVYSLPVIKFNAMKWRSPLGAYFFADCSAVWPQMGTWTEYNVGAFAIS